MKLSVQNKQDRLREDFHIEKLEEQTLNSQNIFDIFESIWAIPLTGMILQKY